MTELKTGILLWSQAATWPEMTDAAKAGRPARLRPSLDVGPPLCDLRRPLSAHLRGAGWPSRAGRWRPSAPGLGLLVGANTFRNPGLTAKLGETLDHISGGRGILGIGGAWFDLEHKAHGIDFGTGFGQRLDWFDEAVEGMRTVIDGGSATSQPGGRYAFHDLRHQPLPIQSGCRS